MNEENKNVSRRQFIGKGLTAVVALTVVPRHVLGGADHVAPSDQITLGFIGTGKQGRILLDGFIPKARIIAGCDVETRKLNKFKENVEAAAQRSGGSAKDLKLYGDFRKLLANKDIDAVVIATPDHWHAINVIEAAKAGKDVYCEKPYSHSIQEGRLMVRAIEKYKRVNQTGNMQRSWKSFRNACQLVRNGHIGDITEVKVCCGPPPKKCDLPAEPLPGNLDWEAWVGPAEYHEFNSILSPPLEVDVYPRWRNYKEYGNGMTADWGAHMFDIAQWALGMDDSGPVEINPANDKEHKHLNFVYANGVKMTHEDFGRDYAVRFIGSKGMIDISRSFFDTLPANLKTHDYSTDAIQLQVSDDHYQNWLDCIKSRQQPISTAEIGHRTATVCFLANIGYELNRRLEWDPVKEEFPMDNDANLHIAGYLRKPWIMKI